MDVATINKFISAVLLIFNATFLFVTFNVLKQGPQGYGYFLLPYLLSYHVFIFSALLSFRKNCNHKQMIVFNGLGIIWIFLTFLYSLLNI